MSYETETIERHGRRYRVEYEVDQDTGPPWKECEGHGMVSNWTTRDKAPGERILSQDHGSKRFYDVAATLTLAKEGQWGDLRDGETADQRAARAVDDDFAFLRAWCQDEWRYVGVIVTLLDNAGKPTDHSTSLWGVETWKDYHREVAQDLAGEVERELAEGREKLDPRIDPDPDVNWRNDAIQFPRLLAEIAATIALTDEQTTALLASMDVDGDQLSELFNRATETWDAIKRRTGPRTA